MKIIISLSLLFSLNLYAASAPANSCSAVLSYSVDEVANSKKLSNLVMAEISKTSRKLLHQVKGASPLFDVICVGAGPQCAAASLTLGNSKLKTVVVEKSSTVASNFAEKDFMINSSETEDLSMHRIPGAKIDFSNLFSGKYGNSTQLAAYIQALQFQSKVPVLLNTEIVGFEMRKVDGHEVVILKTHSGFELRARHVLIGTGLGVADTKIPTPLYKQAFKQSLANSELNPAKLQTVMNTETFMKALKIDPTKRHKVVMPKTIAIIGNGDGARIAVEELLEPYVELPEGFKIYWIGNDYQNADQYTVSQKGWDRYIEKVVVHYNKNRIQGVPGYAIDAQFLENGRLSLTVQEPETKAIKKVEVDLAVDSTGYDNQILKILNSSFGNVSLQDVKGPLKERNLDEATLARQITLETGALVPIYMIGASSGPLLTRDQLTPLKNRNPVSIYNNVPLTAEFAAHLANIEPHPRDLGTRAARPTVLPAEEIFEKLK